MNKIVSLFLRSGPASFEALLAPHVDYLYRIAYRFTGRREDAEDLVQDLLLRLFPQVSTLRKVENLRPWLCRALYNRFIDNTRRHRRDPLTQADGDQALALELGDGAPEQDLESSRLNRRLEAALHTLAAEERALITLHDVEGYTLTELESTLASPLGTLKSRLHRTRKKLRQELKREPFSADLRVKG